MALMLKAVESRNVIVIGKTGTGKSSTCNSLLQTDFFKTYAGGLSGTKYCQQLKKHTWGRPLAIVDTPGTMDVTDPKLALDELNKAMDLCPEGLDAFLLTFRCDVRATAEELAGASNALEIFGSESYKRAIVVFTRADEFENKMGEFEKVLKEMCQAIPTLNSLMTKLQNRWVMLDSSKHCSEQVREEQVMELLQKIDQVAHLNQRRYNLADQQEAQRKQEEIAEKERQLVRKMEADRLQQQNATMLMMEHIKLQMEARKRAYELDKRRTAEREAQLVDMLRVQQEEQQRLLKEQQEEQQRLRDHNSYLTANQGGSSCDLL